jgi:hypothetical protein
MEKVSEKYRKRYEEGENISKAYGTSLIAAAITPWYWFAFHIGDGRFSVLHKDSSGDQPVPWDPKCYLNVTTSICDDDILDRGEEGTRAFLSLHADKEPPVAFFLCSDGIDDNYPVDEKENAAHLYRLYREIAVTCAEEGFESTFGKDGISGQLKDLANGFATRGKGDDTSLAGIVSTEKLKEAAPQWKEKMAADEAERKKAEADAKAKARAETEQREKAAEAAAARKEARKAEREAEKPKADPGEKAGGGENIENYGAFSSNAGQPDSEEAKAKAEIVQDAKRAIDEAAKKIDPRA